MTDFVIDLAWLEGVSGRLAEATSVSRTTLDALEEIGPKRMGHKDLDNACSEFHEKWEERIRGFTQGVDHMREGVAAAKASYGATETAVAASFPEPTAPTAPAAPPATAVASAPITPAVPGQEPHRAGDGLMSDAKEFPGLGFDPAPGIVPAVDGLLDQVRDAVNRLGQVEQEPDSVLRDPAKWSGRSATEFYAIVRGMTANAGVTKGCLFGVQAALSGWSALLGEYQRNGQSLEQQARQARDRLHRAKSSPDLHLDLLSVAMSGGDATGHPDRVQRNVAAKAESESAENELDGIIRAGRNVKHMHDESAKSSAGEIKRAIKALTGEQWRGAHIYPNPVVVYPGPIAGAPMSMDDPDWDYRMAGDVYFDDGPPRPGHSRVELSGPVVPGNGITVLRFFIPTDQAALKALEGDARDFDTTPGAPSRMTLAWDSDTGRVVFDVSPSTTTGFIFDQGKIDAHEVRPGGENDIKLRPNDAGTGFTADIKGLNALLPCFAANEKVGLEFNGPPGSPPDISLKGDDYPNFEAVQYLPNRAAVSHAQDKMYDPQLPLVDAGVAAAPFTGKTRDLEWDDGRPVDPHRYEVDVAPKALPDRIPVDLREVIRPPKQPADP